MCTIMTFRETLPAEKRSATASQQAVDRLMEYERKLSEPFTEKELQKIFSCGALSRHEEYELLTSDEKRLVAELGLTPQEPTRTESDSAPLLYVSKTKTAAEPADPPSVEERRRRLKAQVLKAPIFDGHPYGFASALWKNGIYVWLDNRSFGNSDKTGFYYVRYQLSMLAWGTTAYAHPVLIVQKNKLRSDQVEYMERKCRETLESAQRQQRREAEQLP